MTAAFVLQALGVGVILAGVDFFATHTLDDPDATTFLFVALVGPALVTMPFWNWFGHRYGKRTGFLVCVTIFAVGALSLVTASADRVVLVYLQVAVMGTGYAGTQMFPFAMLPDVIAADAATTGEQRAGAFTKPHRRTGGRGVAGPCGAEEADQFRATTENRPFRCSRCWRAGGSRF